MKQFNNLTICVLSFFCSFVFLFFVTALPTHAIDLTKYFFPSGAPGTSISSGEFFQAIDEGNGYFKIKKSRDDRYYERFRVIGDTIYHIEDTTWATEAGDVMCSDNSGHTAKLAYAGNQGTRWVQRSMEVGECTSSSGEVIGVDETSGNQCSAPHTGSFNRQICLTHQGCIKFPNGTASADAIALTIKQGPGAGEQFFYDADRGWIGFNRGVEDSGAYITEDLAGGTSLYGCLEVKIKSAKCPRGFTCPNTSNIPVKGDVIKVEKSILFGQDRSVRGPTGPTENQLRFPDYSQEEGLFMDKEIIARSMSYEDIKRGYPNIVVPSLQGVLAHEGCEKVKVGGVERENAQIEQKHVIFPLTQSFNKLLVGLRFWESQYVEGKSAKNNITAGQPEEPQTPEHQPKCDDRSGETFNEAATLANPRPPEVGLTIFGQIREWLGILASDVGLSAQVEVKVQQEKYIPGEPAFSEEAHNFLDSFIPYEEKGQPKAQEELNSYSALGPLKSDQPVGFSITGAKSFQEKTVELVKSLRPYEEAKLISTLGPGGTLPAPPVPIPGLYYTIPYKDKDIPITMDRKGIMIFWTKTAWHDTKIEQFWNTIVGQAVSAGVNPALVLAVWIQESGGSSPTFFDGKSPKDGTLDCFPGGGKIFPVETSASCIQEKIKLAPDFGSFVKAYCGTNEPVLCQNNRQFVSGVKSWYDTLVPSGHGAAIPQ